MAITLSSGNISASAMAGITNTGNDFSVVTDDLTVSGTAVVDTSLSISSANRLIVAGGQVGSSSSDGGPLRPVNVYINRAATAWNVPSVQITGGTLKYVNFIADASTGAGCVIGGTGGVGKGAGDFYNCNFIFQNTNASTYIYFTANSYTDCAISNALVSVPVSGVSISRLSAHNGATLVADNGAILLLSGTKLVNTGCQANAKITYQDTSISGTFLRYTTAWGQSVTYQWSRTFGSSTVSSGGHNVSWKLFSNLNTSFSSQSSSNNSWSVSAPFVWGEYYVLNAAPNSAVYFTAAQMLAQLTTNRLPIKSLHFGYKYNPVLSTVTSIDWTADSVRSTHQFSAVMSQDLFVTRTEADVITLQSASTLDDVYDLQKQWKYGASASDANLNYGGLDAQLASASGDLIDFGSKTVVFDANASAAFAVDTATNTITIKSAVISEGSKLKTIKAATITFANGSIAKCIYITAVGASTSLELRDISDNASVAVWDATSGATELYQANGTGSAKTYTVYYPPGSAGTVKHVARELYGYQRAAESITLSPGKMWWTASGTPDVGITQATQATVAAYTALDTSEKLYDFIALKRLDSAFIKLGQIATRSGTAIDFGTYSGVVNKDAASVLAVSGNTVTLKAQGLAGTSKYSKIISAPPATWVASSTEVIDINLEDGNGDSSVTIKASGVSTFDVWKITDATSPDDYATGTLMATVGVGKFRFLHADGYKLVIRDKTTNFRVVAEAEKGDYEAALFFGASVQLAQAPEVSQIKTNLALMQIDIDSIKGAGFTSSDSLHSIRTAVGTPLQASSYTASPSTSSIASAVRLDLEREGGMLDGKASQASITTLSTANKAEHDATQEAISALPAPLTLAETKTAVREALPEVSLIPGGL